jgi:hypothetical protein
MQAEHENRRVGAEDRGIAVTLMDVKIDDGDPDRDPLGDGGHGGQREVVQCAEAGAEIRMRVMGCRRRAARKSRCASLRPRRPIVARARRTKGRLQGIPIRRVASRVSVPSRMMKYEWIPARAKAVRDDGDPEAYGGRDGLMQAPGVIGAFLVAPAVKAGDQYPRRDLCAC